MSWLTIAVSGAPPFGFRWRLGTATSVPFGLGTSNLTIANVQLTNAGYYTVVVTNIDSPFGVLSAPAALTVLVDTDGDHMPDEWEMAHGLNRLVNDAALDPDGKLRICLQARRARAGCMTVRRVTGWPECAMLISCSGAHGGQAGSGVSA